MTPVSEQSEFDRQEEKTVGRARKRLILFIAFGLIVGAVLGAYITVDLVRDRRQGASEMPGVESFENLTYKHTDGYVTYEQTPPVGGDHNPVWQDAGFYESQVPEERAVHTLEHGAVWITYSFDLPEDQKEKLRQVVEGQDCLLASPYPYLPAPVVASAWGRQLQLDDVDDPDLQEFIRLYRKGSQTPEPGAPCTGATQMNQPPKDDNQ